MKAWMKAAILLPALVGLLLPITAAAGDLIKKGETLDLQQCIDIALKNHPSLLAASHTLKAGESRVGQARSGYFPQVSGSVIYNRISPYATSSGGRLAPSGDGTYDTTNSAIALSQNLFDFGKTAAQVKIQKLNLDSSRSDFEDVRSQVVFDVQKAYYGLLQAGRNRNVGREVVSQYEQHLARAKGFFQIGVKPKFDVTKAEVDLSNAKLSLLKAENAFRVARVTLNNAMGIPKAPDFEIQDSLAFLRAEVDLDQSLQKAFDRRPDLQAILVKEKALEETIAFEKKGYLPYVTGNAIYGWGGNSFPLDHGWTIGATVNIPLFSGLSTKYQVDEARANLEVLRANEEALRQGIHLEVRQAWLNLQEAADRIVTAEISVRQAMENLGLANGRYASGVGSPIEVTDALVAESNAKTSLNAALYDYKVAQASMDRATGEK